MTNMCKNGEWRIELIPIEYNWMCPVCEKRNIEFGYAEFVKCEGCGKQFETQES